MSAAARQTDMVTLNVIDSTMVAICREMGIVLMKTSYSNSLRYAMLFCLRSRAGTPRSHSLHIGCPSNPTADPDSDWGSVRTGVN